MEKHLRHKHNIDRQLIGREEFNRHVMAWRDQYGDDIKRQLQTLGTSLDWSRVVFTMDEKRTRAVNHAFVELFKQGLIYRKKALVNWCSALRSTVSDIEVDSLHLAQPTDVQVPDYQFPVRFGVIYNFAYKIFDSHEEVVVATTMPETMFGDTAIAVHPNDPRYILFTISPMN